MLSTNHQPVQDPVVFSLEFERIEQLESWSFRLERTVDRLSHKVSEMFHKLLKNQDQHHETLSLLVNTNNTIQARMSGIEQVQKDLKTDISALKSDVGAMNKKLDQLISLLTQKGV